MKLSIYLLLKCSSYFYLPTKLMFFCLLEFVRCLENIKYCIKLHITSGRNSIKLHITPRRNYSIYFYFSTKILFFMFFELSSFKVHGKYKILHQTSYSITRNCFRCRLFCLSIVFS